MSLTIIAARADNLPDIEAHQFKIMPLEKSRTGRVYRFKTDAEQLPRTGSILLIQENDKPTMAFRVLKTDREHTEFIARRVRRYDVSSELKINQRYTSVEKIADLVAPPPGEITTFDPKAKPLLDPIPNKNLNSRGAGGVPPQLDPFGTGSGDPLAANNSTASPATEGAVDAAATPSPDAGSALDSSSPSALDSSNQAANSAKPLDVEKYDDDLDSSTSPTNLKTASGADDATPGAEAAPPPEKSAETDDYNLEVKEKVILNPYQYLAGFSVASMKNLSNLKFGGGSYAGGMAYFSQVIKRNLVFKRAVPQDSLSLEFGVGYYSDDNVNQHNDDYDIVPLRIELRYDIHLSELFTTFVYLGGQYNLILSAVNVDTVNNIADATAYSNRHGPQANIGVGLFYNFGPQWYLRGDLGLDRVGLGLAIRW